MSVSNMTLEQASAVLTSVYEQATGKSVLTPTTVGDFVSVANVVLRTGYDTVLNAISQVMSRTIFSIRPYNAKLKGLFVSPERYGNHVRKINYIDGALDTNDQRYTLVDGQSIDHWEVNKPKTVQTNFYGQFAYQRHTTILKDQLDMAFTGPAQFGDFVTGQMQNVYDQLEQVREQYARMALNNMIAGKVTANNGVYHVLTAYNTATGLSLTATDLWKPANFPAFIKWFYGWIRTLTDFMSQRSIGYHINITGSEIMRHTPADRMKMYLTAEINNAIESMVKGDVFHDEKLRMMDHESITYWQSIDTPYDIDVTPTYLDASSGGLLTPAGSVQVSDIMGVLFDEEAIGVSLVNQWSSNTGLNAAGGYSNTYFHENVRIWNDFSENCVILLLD